MSDRDLLGPCCDGVLVGRGDGACICLTAAEERALRKAGWFFYLLEHDIGAPLDAIEEAAERAVQREPTP